MLQNGTTLLLKVILLLTRLDSSLTQESFTMNTADPEKDTVSNQRNEQNGDSHKLPTTLEDAIVLTGHGKFHLFLLVGCGMGLIAMVGEIFGTAFLIPAAQCEFDMGATEKGLLNAINYIGMIASSHLWGYLADTQGRRKILIIAIILDGVCALLSSIAHTYWLFALLRFFNGFFICAPSAVVFAYLGEFHSESTRTRSILFLSVFLSLGGLFQQGMAWLVIPQEWTVELPWPNIMFSSWRLFVVISGIPSFIAGFILYFLPETPKFLFSSGKEEEALDVLRHVFTINTGRKPEEYPVTKLVLDMDERASTSAAQPTSVMEIIKSMWFQTKPLFQSPNVLLTSLSFSMQFILFACFGGFALWLPDIYNRLAIYAEQNPDHTLTICEVFEALKNNTIVTDIVLQSTEIVNQTSADLISYQIEMNNLTSSSSVLGNIDALTINTLVNNIADTTSYIFNNITMNAVQNGTGLYSDTTSVPTCTSTVNPTVFRNSLFIGCVCITVYTGTGYLVSFLKKKPLMVFYLLVSTVTGASLYLVNVEWLVVAMASIFIATSGVSVNIVNSIVIDNIPTQLRAMAVCLSLMLGRFGVTVCSLVFGIILDTSCDAAFFMLSGLLLICCFLTCFLPEAPKTAS